MSLPGKEPPLKRSWILGLVAIAGLSVSSGCEEKGPAQKAGENVDKAARNAADALNPKGPLEKAGRAVDDATK